jgi:hypothetical protein
VRCDQVRDQLAEQLLGTLEERADAAVRSHLRGCGSCRAEISALADGVATLAAAAHDVEPPAELRGRILDVLEDEWAAGPPAEAAPSRRRGWRVAAAGALAAALVWAAVATVLATRFAEQAENYDRFLGVLGGEDVRVGELASAGARQLQGSVVVYDSSVGQSWVLVLVRAPGWEGEVNVTMVAAGGRTIDLHPLTFDAGGEASTWLVTPSDLRGFDQVNLWDERGRIATASIAHA